MRISFHSTRNKSVCLLLLGMLSAFAMAPYYIVPFLAVGLSVLLAFLNKAKMKESLILGFAFGFGFGSVSTAWLANALMVDNGAFAIFIPLAWAGMGLLFGIFTALPALLCMFYPAGIRRYLAFAALFTIFEWVRSWLLTGFPWNLLGQTWSFSTPMLQSAQIWGVYGLSFITILTLSVGAFLPKRKPLLISGVVLATLFLGGLWRLYDATPAEVWGVKLRLVQPNIPQSLKWDPDEADRNYSKILSLSRTNNQDITHVIWPESAVAFLVDRNEGERARMMGAVRQGGTLITGGLRGVDLSKDELANSIFVLDDFANIVTHYDKSHLVPFGEYMPLRQYLLIDKIVPLGGDFVQGSGVRNMKIPKAPVASPLVCYEIIFSGAVARSDKRPAWIINVSNDAWYGLSAGPYQHFDMAQMRAVEEGLPVVRAANNGISGVIDPYGRVIASLDLGAEGVVDSSLPKAIPATPYAKTGPLLPVGICFILLLISIKKRKIVLDKAK